MRWPTALVFITAIIGLIVLALASSPSSLAVPIVIAVVGVLAIASMFAP